MRFCTHASPNRKLQLEALSLYYHHSQIHTKADLRLTDNNLLERSEILRVSPNVPPLNFVRIILFSHLAHQASPPIKGIAPNRP